MYEAETLNGGSPASWAPLSSPCQLQQKQWPTLTRQWRQPSNLKKQQRRLLNLKKQRRRLLTLMELKTTRTTSLWRRRRAKKANKQGLSTSDRLFLTRGLARARGERRPLQNILELPHQCHLEKDCREVFAKLFKDKDSPSAKQENRPPHEGRLRTPNGYHQSMEQKRRQLN